MCEKCLDRTLFLHTKSRFPLGTKILQIKEKILSAIIHWTSISAYTPPTSTDPPPVPPLVSSSVEVSGSEVLVEEGVVTDVECTGTPLVNIHTSIACQRLQPHNAVGHEVMSGVISRSRTDICTCTRAEASGCYTARANVTIRAACELII